MLLDPLPGFDLDLDVEMEHGSKDQPSGGGKANSLDQDAGRLWMYLCFRCTLVVFVYCLNDELWFYDVSCAYPHSHTHVKYLPLIC